MKTAIIALSALFAGLVSAQNMCGDYEVMVSGIKGRVQCDYRHEASKHFKQSGSTYNFWGYTGDKPHSKNSNTNPRTEMTLKAYTFDYNAVTSFEGRFRVPTYVRPPFIIFQIFNQRKNGDTGSATSLHLTCVGNDLKPSYGGSKVYKHGVKSDDPNSWTRVKVEVNKGTIKIFVDGKHVDTQTLEKPGAPYHFKFGSYAGESSNETSQKTKFEIFWDNIVVKK